MAFVILAEAIFINFHEPLAYALNKTCLEARHVIIVIVTCQEARRRVMRESR